MKKAIVLSDVSGAGKTHVRLNDPELKDLPCVDVADIYESIQSCNGSWPTGSWFAGLWNYRARTTRW